MQPGDHDERLTLPKFSILCDAVSDIIFDSMAMQAAV